jgi:hypothetical protein
MDNASLDRLIVVMFALIPGQALFIKFFADVRPSTSYVIGVIVGIAAANVMVRISRRNRSF